MATGYHIGQAPWKSQAVLTLEVFSLTGKTTPGQPLPTARSAPGSGLFHPARPRILLQ